MARSQELERDRIARLSVEERILLALGLRRGSAALRHAGMALVCLVVAKVFLVDMAGLKGLLRVFSFLGLGAALVGLGYAYRRFASGKP